MVRRDPPFTNHIAVIIVVLNPDLAMSCGYGVSASEGYLP
jgi:hypothetical protein